MPAKKLTYSAILVLITTLVALYAVQWVRADSRVAWTELGTAEQEVLEPFTDQWDTLSGKRQGRLLTSARRWLVMTREERVAAQQRLERWQALPKERRQRIQKLIERFQAMPVQRQEQLREVRDWYRALPSEKQASLRQRWQIALQPEPPTEPATAPETPPAGPSARPSSEITREAAEPAREAEAQSPIQGDEAEWKALEHQLRAPDTPDPQDMQDMQDMQETPGGAPFDAEQHPGEGGEPPIQPGSGDFGAGPGALGAPRK